MGEVVGESVSQKARIVSPVMDAYFTRYIDSGVYYYQIGWKMSNTITYFVQFGTNGYCTFYKVENGATTVIKRW